MAGLQPADHSSSEEDDAIIGLLDSELERNARAPNQIPIQTGISWMLDNVWEMFGQCSG
jgi:acyl-CoA hydrolase